jgi:hypothetical protein
VEPLWVDVVILSGLLAVAVALLAVLLNLAGRRLLRLEQRHERLVAIVTAHLSEWHYVSSMPEAQAADQRQIDLLAAYNREE